MNNLSALEKEIIKDLNTEFQVEQRWNGRKPYKIPVSIEEFIISALRKQREMIVETLMKERKDHSAEKDEDIQVKE